MRALTMLAVLVASAITIIQPRAASAGNRLATFLDEVERAGFFHTPARAEFHVTVKEHTETREYDGVALHSGANIYVEFSQQKVHLIVRSHEDKIYQTVAGGPVRVVSATEPIGDTTLVPEDFRSFRSRALVYPQITSETRQTMLVSGAPPQPSPYVLLAYVIDRKKYVPIRFQYYERVINNLVRLRLDTELLDLAGGWRPQKSNIEDYRAGTVTTIVRRWSTSTDLPPRLFDPKTMATRALSPRR